MVWSLINSGEETQPASGGHSATVIGTKMFVFGGVKEEDNAIEGVRVFDTETSRWMSAMPSVPGHRVYHAAFAYNSELYIVGGFDLDVKQHSNDLWKLNSKTFSWKKLEPKGNVMELSGAVCSCLLEDEVVLSDPDLVFQMLHLNPSLKTLCKLAVIQSAVDQSGLPHDIRWEPALK